MAASDNVQKKKKKRDRCHGLQYGNYVPGVRQWRNHLPFVVVVFSCANSRSKSRFFSSFNAKLVSIFYHRDSIEKAIHFFFVLKVSGDFLTDGQLQYVHFTIEFFIPLLFVLLRSIHTLGHSHDKWYIPFENDKILWGHSTSTCGMQSYISLTFTSGSSSRISRPVQQCGVSACGLIQVRDLWLHHGRNVWSSGGTRAIFSSCFKTTEKSATDTAMPL